MKAPPLLPILAFALALAAACAQPAAGDGAVTMPQILTDRLDNGMELIMLPTKAVPLVTINLAAKTGAYVERKDNNGLSHLYEHMFFKGNAAIPDQEAYNQRMRRLGIVHNGTTATEGVQYFFTLPGRNLEAGMEFMAQALLTPKFEQSELEKERVVVLGEYDRNEASPTFHLDRAVTDAVYWKFPWRKNAIGARDIIATANVDQMREFQRVFYVPNNCALIVVGDFAPDQARTLAHKFFGEWKAGANPHDPPREPHPAILESRTIVVNQPIRFAVVRLTTYGPNCRQDPQATFAADVFGTMISLPTCRFQKQMVESRLAAQAAMGYYTQSEGGEINVWLQLAPPSLPVARDTLFAEIAAMADPKYFTANELADAKRNLMRDRLYEMEAGQAFSRNLAFWWVVGGVDYYRDYLEQVNQINLEDVNRFVKKYLLGKPYVMGVLTSAEIQKQMSWTDASLAGPARLGEATARATPIGGPGTSAGDEMPVKAVDPQDAPASAGDEKDAVSFAVPTQDGANVQVIFQPIRENDVVAVQVFFRGGSLNIAEDKGGLENLLIQTMVEASERYPKDKMQEIVSRTGLALGAETTYDYSVLTLKCLRHDLTLALDVLGDVMKSPRLDAADLEEVRGRILQTLQQEDSDPDEKVWHVANRGLFADHPYRSRPKGTLETLPRLTVEDLRAHRGRLMGAARTLIAVVGNLSRAELEKRLGAALGWLPKGESAPSVPSFPAAARGSIHVENKDIPTVYVVAKFALPGPGDPEFPAVRMGIEVLSERLGDVIRTQHALSYAVSASTAWYRSNFGNLYVTTTEPQKTLALMFAEVERLRTEPVTAEFLREVANPLYTQFFMRDETNTGQAGSLGRSEIAGLGWKSARTIADRFYEVTPEQVQKGMAKWLHNFHFGIIGKEDLLDQAQLEGFTK